MAVADPDMSHGKPLRELFISNQKCLYTDGKMARQWHASSIVTNNLRTSASERRRYTAKYDLIMSASLEGKKNN